MHESIKSHNKGLMEDVLKRQQDSLDTILDENGNSLLILAVLNGDAEMLNILLGKDLNPNLQNDQGNTALHYAIMNQRHKCVDILIQYGVNETLENNEGLTPWMMQRSSWNDYTD